MTQSWRAVGVVKLSVSCGNVDTVGVRRMSSALERETLGESGGRVCVCGGGGRGGALDPFMPVVGREQDRGLFGATQN